MRSALALSLWWVVWPIRLDPHAGGDDGLVCDQNPCVGDVNRDNAVNTADLLLVLSVFGRQSCEVDIVQTTAWPGLVNTDDLLALLAAFGDTC